MILFIYICQVYFSRFSYEEKSYFEDVWYMLGMTDLFKCEEINVILVHLVLQLCNLMFKKVLPSFLGNIRAP